MRRTLRSTEASSLLTVVIWRSISPSRSTSSARASPLAFAAIATGRQRFVGYIRARALLRVRASPQLGQVGSRSWLFLNQICFVYALELTTATTVAADPRDDAGVRRALRIAGRARACPAGSGSPPASPSRASPSSRPARGRRLRGPAGILLRSGWSATWAAYSVAIAPLMRTYSPYRISTLVLDVMCVPLGLVASPQMADQDFDSAGCLARLRVRRRRAARLTTSSGSRRCIASVRRRRRSSRTSSRSSLRSSRSILLSSRSPPAGRRRRPIAVGLSPRGSPRTVAAPASKIATVITTISCRSRAGITSSSGSAMRSSRRTSTSMRSASRRWPTPARRRASATARRTCSSRATSASSSRAACARTARWRASVTRTATA